MNPVSFSTVAWTSFANLDNHLIFFPLDWPSVSATLFLVSQTFFLSALLLGVKYFFVILNGKDFMSDVSFQFEYLFTKKSAQQGCFSIFEDI